MSNVVLLNPTQHEKTMLQAKRMIERAIKKGRKSFMLWGLPGIGKTSVVYQIGAAWNWKVIEYKTNTREPVDARGVPGIDKANGTTKWYVPDELPRVERDGEYGILLVDEINTGTIQMMAVMMGLAQERKVGDYRLPDGWIVIATGNDVKHKAAARAMPTALRNRFAHIYIKPDVDSVATYWNSIGVPGELIAFIRLRREDVLHIMPKGDENAYPTPRSLEQCKLYIDEDEDIRMDLFAMEIGDACAAELDGFVKFYHSIATLDAIIKDPQGTDVPSERSLMYVTCTGLGRMATRKNFDNILAYAQRLPREYEELIVADATERDESLKNTKAYVAYTVRNQDLHIHQ